MPAPDASRSSSINGGRFAVFSPHSTCNVRKWRIIPILLRDVNCFALVLRSSKRNLGGLHISKDTNIIMVTPLPLHPEDGQNTAAFRAPPRNVEAEMGLLGAILVNNRALERVSEFLEATHFADPVHARIYEVCATIIERGQHADPTTLRHYLENDEAFESVGGVQYLASLATNAVTIINAEHYGKLIHDLFLRRQLIDLGTDMVNDAYEAELDEEARHQIEHAEQSLYDLATTGDYEGGFQPFTQALAGAIDMAQAAFKRDGGLAGLATHFRKLDLMLGGLHPSDLLIIAGRPSMGKTAFATNIAFNAAKAAAQMKPDAHGKRPGVGFFSLEMSSEQLATRILAEAAQIPSDKIRRGELNSPEFEKVVRASQDLQTAPLFIDDTPALSVSALRTRARRLKRQHGLALIVVDYLQLLQGSSRSSENRVQEISEITRGLKTLAKELDVPVVALSQLSRAVEQRDDKRPQLSDLRESGTIEQDADVVMFVYREEYYLERAEPTQRADEAPEKHQLRHEQWEERRRDSANKAEIIIAKQRHGPTGKLELWFLGELTKFMDMTEDDAGPEFEEPPY